MMLVELKPHPETPCAALAAITVGAARPEPGLLALRYTFAGNIAGVKFPPKAGPERADNLWAATCCEAFVKTASGEAYYEFNLSPSTQWAAYHFDGYREGMALAEIAPPKIIAGANPTHFDLETLLHLPPTSAPWRLGLSVVIEEISGAKSYWAIKHPNGKPDFHHGDGFQIEL
jgi:hypothetical protein